jgi:hypothetical protein
MGVVLKGEHGDFVEVGAAGRSEGETEEEAEAGEAAESAAP